MAKTNCGEEDGQIVVLPSLPTHPQAQVSGWVSKDAIYRKKRGRLGYDAS